MPPPPRLSPARSAVLAFRGPRVPPPSRSAALVFFFGPEIRRQRLLTRGIPAEAEILAVEERGITAQGNYPVGRFRFLIYPPQGESYETTAKCTIGRFEPPAFVPGAMVRILIDPRDPKKVALA